MLREQEQLHSRISYSASELLVPVNWLGVATQREALIQLFQGQSADMRGVLVYL